jgi:inosine/xanthosine triphosphate pyrophosphatase family protein
MQVLNGQPGPYSTRFEKQAVNLMMMNNNHDDSKEIVGVSGDVINPKGESNKTNQCRRMILIRMIIIEDNDE